MYKAKYNFLWFQQGQLISTDDVEMNNWHPHVELVVEKKPTIIVEEKKVAHVVALPSTQFDKADVNKDGKVDLKDAVEVVKRMGKQKPAKRK